MTPHITHRCNKLRLLCSGEVITWEKDYYLYVLQTCTVTTTNFDFKSVHTPTVGQLPMIFISFISCKVANLEMGDLEGDGVPKYKVELKFKKKKKARYIMNSMNN